MTAVAIPPSLVVIELGDLVLRAPDPSDAAAVVAAFADPQLRQWNPPPVHDDDPDAAALAWIRDRADWSAGLRVAWVVAEAAPSGTGPLLGSVSIRVEAHSGNGSIGYWTAPPARGRGVATRAVRAATRFAFDVVGVHRIELAHAVANPPSCRVAHGAGFPLEGVLREAYTYGDGARYDEHLHAKLATDPD
ncbi:GNAT family N-acetyltransferase [Dactylosporangium sp. CA-092794]|uniref:GNAT family N-acetyltransferase n=1 Tax=Dactylosporangium sp. CA-092794 TaxID=3239929 RepID=UPI003D912A24